MNSIRFLFAIHFYLLNTMGSVSRPLSFEMIVVSFLLIEV